MRIGLEMVGTQSPSRARGIGRYCRNLASALLARGAAVGHEFVLYAVDCLPTDRLPTAPNAVLRPLTPSPHLREVFARVVHENPDGLDALVFLNPLEINPGNDVPIRPPGVGGPRLAALIHDLIPLAFPDLYLKRWPGNLFARRYLWALERLRTYDRLLTNSASTRDDVLRMLNAAPERVVAVGTGGDDSETCFTPGAGDPDDDDRLSALGLVGSFVFTVAAADARKNLAGAIDAFALLPGPLRNAHRLAVTADLTPGEAAHFRGRAEARGIVDALTFTGPVDDPTLRALYRRCASFLFPSRYEGFGLPILEALACGASVVAGDNSAQPEVAGDAALLVNADDPEAVASALARLLTDGALARTLRDRGPARAARFRWDDVAGRVLGALETPGDHPRAGVSKRPSSGRPRLALFTPLPPTPSGVAEYAVPLAEALGRFYEVDLFHDEKAFPFARFGLRGSGCFDHRLFDQIDRVRPYRAVVYQLGNSPAHVFADDALRKRPGLVILHDLSLGSFHYERATRRGGGLDAFREALEEAHPDRAGEFPALLARWSDDPPGMVRGLNDAGLDMNRGVVDRALGVVVHSRSALARLGPEAAGKARVVPLGADPTPHPSNARTRAEARARLGLPVDALIVASFGSVHPSKRNVEGLRAFGAVAGADPRALFVFAGEEADDGLARREAAALGLADRVRFWGRASGETYRTLIAAADVGLALRRPPTNGESSASLLDLLRAGVATVTTDAGSFAEFPDGAVRKVRRVDGSDLARALADLIHDPAAREATGRAAWEHVRAVHAWDRVGEGYAEAVARSVSGHALRGPHRVKSGAPTVNERGGR